MNQRIKSTIFHITHSLAISLPLALVTEILSNLQIVHTILKNIFTDYTYKYDIPSKLADYLSSLISGHNFSSLNYLDEILTIWIWSSLAFYLFLHMLLMIIILIVQPKHEDSKMKKLLRITAISYLFHSRVIFFIIHYFLVGILGSYNTCDLTKSTEFRCQPYCFAMSINFCIVNLGLSLIIEFLLYDINKNKKNAYAVKNNFFHQTVLFYKALAIVLFLLLEDAALTNKINSAVSTCFTLIALITLYIKLPFYNIKVLKASLVTCGIALSFSIISVIGAFEIDKRVLSAMWIVLTPLLTKSLLIFFNILSNKIMQGDFTSPAKAIHFVIMLEQHNFGYSPASFYSELRISLGRLVSNGLLAIEKKENQTEIEASKTKKQYEEKIYTFILEKLTTVLEKNPTSELLLLFMAQIYLKKLLNIPKATTLMRRVESRNFSIPIRNSITSFNIKASEFFKKNHVNNDPDSLNLVYYFKHRMISNSIKEIIQKEVNNHLEFWEEIKKNKIDVKKVIDLATQIESISARITSKWQSQIMGSKKHFLNSLIMYSTYLEVVKEDQPEAKKYLTEFLHLSHIPREDQMFDVYSDRAAAVLVSIQKTNFGIILDASGSAQTIFAVEKHMLIGQSVRCLFPSIAGDDLFRHLVKYAHRLMGKLDYNPKSYAKASNGDIFEIEIELKLYPEVSGQIKVMLLFKKLAIPKPIMIVDTKGLVLECSESLKKEIFPNQEKNASVIDLQKIAIGFDKINNAFNQVYGFSNDTTKSQSTVDLTMGSILLKKRSLYDKVYMQQIKNVIQDEKQRNINQMTSADALDQEEAKQICNDYSQGNKLTFISHTLRMNKAYHVQITPFQTNDTLYKIIAFVLTKDKRMLSHNFGSRKISSVFEAPISDFAAEFSEVDERKPDPKSKEQEFVNKGKRFFLDVKDITRYPAQARRARKDNTFLLGAPISKKASNSHEQLMQYAKHDHHHENSVASALGRKATSLKAIKVFLGRAKPYHLSRTTTWALCFLLLFHIGLAVTSFVISELAITQVESGVEIINFASLRLSQAIRGWQTSTRFFLRYIKLANGKVQTIKDNINSNGVGMLQNNKELMKRFSYQINEDFVRVTVKANIDLWEPYENVTIGGGQIDSFAATNLLARKMIAVGISTEDINAPVIVDSVRFLANNTSNDYLVASEDLIFTTQGMLDLLIKDNISKLYLVLGGEIGALATICICLLYGVWKIVKLYKKLFGTLIKIDEANASQRVNQLKKMKLLLSQELEAKQFTNNALDFFKLEDDIAQAKAKQKVQKRIPFQSIDERIIMWGVLKNLAKHVVFSVLIIQTITASFITSLADSISNFQSLENRNTQLSVTTRAGYQTSAIFGTFYTEIVWGDNSSMLVRNDLPRNQLMKNVEAISNLNNEILSVFSSNDGSISDPLIKEMLQGITLCKFLSKTVQDYCQNATANGNIGILSVNSKLFMAMQYYTKRFLDNPAYNNTKSYFDEYVSIVRPCGDTLDEAYRFINSHILDGLRQDLDSFTMKTKTLHLVILLTIIFSAVAIQRTSMQRLKTLDMCRGLILKTVSYNILLEDHAISFYLNKHFVNKKSKFSSTL